MNTDQNLSGNNINSNDDTVIDSEKIGKSYSHDTELESSINLFQRQSSVGHSNISDAVLMASQASLNQLTVREIKYAELYHGFRQDLELNVIRNLFEYLETVEPADEMAVFKDLLKLQIRNLKEQNLPCGEKEFIAQYGLEYKKAIKDIFSIGLEFGDGLVGIGYIGSGGMGEIYLAKPKFANLGNVKRAIKVAKREQLLEIFNERSKYLRQTFAEFEKEVQTRFMREIEISTFLESVSHPKKEQIVKCYSSGMTANQELYLVMEFIEGLSLLELNQKYRSKTGKPLPYQAVCSICFEAAETLHFLHEYIIHRDIKPQNIMYSQKDKRLKILDFGISKFIKSMPIEDQYEEFALNSTTQGLGGYKGTPSYSPLEQFFDASNVDHRSDLFSLGCTMFELLDQQGLSPYRYETSQNGNLLNRLIEERMMKPIPQLVNPTCPEKLKQVILQLMSQQVSDRQSSAQVLAEQLLPFKDDKMLDQVLMFIDGKIDAVPLPEDKIPESPPEKPKVGIMKWIFGK